MAATMHLASILAHSPAPHSIGVWRHPRSFNGFDYNSPQYWEHLARTLERGCFDMLFLADTFNLHDEYGANPDIAIRYGLQFPRSDPAPLIPMMGRVTKDLCFGLTANTTYMEPFYLARLFATLDDLTQGRIGWNVVAGFSRSEAANFGRSDVLSHKERYERAEEYMALCYKLWNSWEPDAVVRDKQSGVFADPAKVHRVNHVGKYFRCEGPLSVPHTPQGKPTIIQAGASPEGVGFAARHAEIHFATRGTTAGMKQHRARMIQALAAEGRPADAMKILWGAMVFIGDDEASARNREQRMLERIAPEAGLALMSGHFGHDLSKLPMDKPMEKIAVSGSHGILESVINDFGPGTTLAEAGRRYGCGLAGLRMYGSPRQIADQMEEAFDAAGDGFMVLSTDCLPGSVDDFVDLVVPQLQARGIFRKSYEEGTLREKVFGKAADRRPQAAAE
jgi:FMN-dependent oxidoreductase (nitrilotriacetate monooxygenase family)